MLIDRERPGVQDKLATELRRETALERVVGWIEAAAEPVTLEVDRVGIELAPAGSQATAPRRSRMKIFRARAGKERFCAFFYKRSNLPWSRDRFSYGGVEFLPDQIGEAEVQGWLAWLASGLDPERRPERLRRSFLYDVPD